jgi:hypothetical protein
MAVSHRRHQKSQRAAGVSVSVLEQRTVMIWFYVRAHIGSPCCRAWLRRVCGTRRRATSSAGNGESGGVVAANELVVGGVLASVETVIGL